MALDPYELAWAAGFFDGEGTTLAKKESSRPGYYQLHVTIPQSGYDKVPPSLLRFQAAFGSRGSLVGPADNGMYYLRFSSRVESNWVLDSMWPHLGEIKRAQADAARKIVRLQYESGTYAQRRPRRVLTESEQQIAGGARPRDLELAWAAGFLDGEGCFGLAHVGPRARGPDWYRVRVSVTQHGTIGSPPQVLLRLQGVLGGIGRIERHSDADDYKWVAEGADHVESVLVAVERWLGDEKRDDAVRALDAFRGQVRLKGDDTHCVRGHRYTKTALKGGRMRKICLLAIGSRTGEAGHAAVSLHGRSTTSRAATLSSKSRGVA